MTITLPDEVRDGLERKARAAGFATITEYLTDLAAEPKPDAELTYADLGYSSEEELEAKLLASLASPPILVTPEFWTDLQKKVEARAEQLKGEQ